MKKSPEMIKNEQALSDLRRAVNVADKVQRGVVALERALGIENYYLELEERKDALIPEIDSLKKKSRTLKAAVKNLDQEREDKIKEFQILKDSELGKLNKILSDKKQEVSSEINNLSKNLSSAQAEHKIDIQNMNIEKETLSAEVSSIRSSLDKLLSSVKTINKDEQSKFDLPRDKNVHH